MKDALARGRLWRAGGSVTITRREFAEIAERYGGPSRMVLRMETIAGGEGIRLSLARKEPDPDQPPG